MVSEMQRQTVHRHVQAARKAGARVVLGGEMPPSKAAGTFYPPTVLADVPHAAKEVTQRRSLAITPGCMQQGDICIHAPGDRQEVPSGLMVISW